MQSPWHRKDQTHTLVHAGSQICFAQPSWWSAKHEPAEWCGSTECQQHTGLQQQPAVWGKGSVPSTWHLLHITWRAYSVSSSSSFRFGARHILINLIIFSGELPPRRLGLEQISFRGNSAQAKEEMALWYLIPFQYLRGGYRESGPSLVTMAYSRTMKGYNQTKTEKVLSKYKEKNSLWG